ncbi:hypothetical protein EJ04DRAFT_223663 [Polyplosphaeria fusca]|uniref:Uncharacterized protein n=1 Tax=Polyplosphaeria fusca TaxID=682080 RepID=A0A9P4V391_9PLEO|nr:hypothetical protein EJ04DRAFT_223663 [Polyplosphaeria fusca]
MLRKKRKRGEEEGKETKFVLHGHQVADESVLRFQERMTKSGKIKEEDTFSDISTPGSLACFTPSPSLNTSLTTLHIPSRLNVIRTDDSPGFEKNRFFSPVNLLDYLADTNLMTSYSDTTPPGININRLVEEVLRFGRLPDGEKEAKFLDFVISLNADCDELCSQCPPFGYDSGSAGCLIHRSLSYILAQYDREAWSATKATLLCREIIADASAMLRPGYAPLASLLRIAIDIVYLFARTGSMDDIQCLAVDILGISSRFLHEDQYTYRALLAICAHILAQNGHCKTAVSTLKYPVLLSFDIDF